MKRMILVTMLGLVTIAAIAQENGLTNLLRGKAALDSEARPELMPKMVNNDKRAARAFPEQPPLIPHQIEGYQVDREFNKCLSCHAREKVAESQAPMVSVTHFVNRDGNTLSQVSPRRYFCTQCHVPQMDIKAPIDSTFVDAASAAAEKKGR